MTNFLFLKIILNDRQIMTNDNEMLCRKAPRIGTHISRILTILIGVPSGGTPSVENRE